jgi:hypothetical protein
MGAGRLGMTILPADGDRGAACGGGKARNQGGRWAHHQIGFETCRAVDDLGKLALGDGKPVHLPVARHQRR